MRKQVDNLVDCSSAVLTIKGNSLDCASNVTTINYDNIYDYIMKKFSIKPTIEYKCHNCGAVIELDNDKHIFICRYCGSAYAVGTNMINDKG